MLPYGASGLVLVCFPYFNGKSRGERPGERFPFMGENVPGGVRSVPFVRYHCMPTVLFSWREAVRSVCSLHVDADIAPGRSQKGGRSPLALRYVCLLSFFLKILVCDGMEKEHTLVTTGPRDGAIVCMRTNN